MEEEKSSMEERKRRDEVWKIHTLKESEAVKKIFWINEH